MYKKITGDSQGKINQLIIKSTIADFVLELISVRLVSEFEVQI
jgi:hypothetical protein